MIKTGPDVAAGSKRALFEMYVEEAADPSTDYRLPLGLKIKLVRSRVSDAWSVLTRKGFYHWWIIWRGVFKARLYFHWLRWRLRETFSVLSGRLNRWEARS